VIHLRRGSLPAVLLLCGALLLAFGASAARAVPTLAAPTVVAGPDPGIVALNGMSIARDGSGGVVYTDQVAGVTHVFVSRLAGGIFQAPQQLDAALPGASSQPVIAAGNNGVLLIGFINGGSLYAVDRTAGSTAFPAPILLAAGAANPAISMSFFGKAYLAFTAIGAGGHDIRAAYYFAGSWSLEPTPMDAVASDDAGTGSGRPAVVTAGDGVGIVAWGEAGHVFARRVWGTAPSVVYQQADVPTLSGWTEVSSGTPSIGAGADSSYVDIGFQETLANGAQTQSRALMDRLVAGSSSGITAADGLSTPGPEGAADPQLVMDDSGRGYMTSGRTSSDEVTANVLGTTGANAGILRVDSLTNTAPPDAVPATAGFASLLIGWQQTASPPGVAEIRVRYAPTGAFSLGPELVASTPILGATNADAGLVAGGDVFGDGALAWVQGSGASTRIVAALLYQPPGSFAASRRITYTGSRQPVLSWSTSREAWGPVVYQVTLDGVPVLPRTGATAYRPAVPLSDGPHTYQVTAYNTPGGSQPTKVATVLVDTIAPRARISLSGTRRSGASVHLQVRDSDVRPPEPAADSSGVASVAVNWGDGLRSKIGHTKSHVYSRPGLYKLTVTVTDRAGNKATVLRFLRIAPRIR
jgi:hypothetical protein